MTRCVDLQRRSLADRGDCEAMGLDELALYQGDPARAAKGFAVKAEFEARTGERIDPEWLPYTEKLAEAQEAAGDLRAAREAYEQAARDWEQRLSAGHPRAQWCRERAASLPSPP
jgi:gamma-glutamyl:cysteine ligase YbdK (ATP-grasp superfamily)